jgi:hypothetical protein
MSEPHEHLDQIHNQGMSTEDAYKLGVQEVDPNASVIFVDPDKIRMRSPGPPGKSPFGSNYQAPARSLNQQMESQVPGSTDAIVKKFEESEGIDISRRDTALTMKNHGPAALDNLKVNGSENGVAIIPSHEMDSKEEVILEFLQGEYSEDEPVYSEAEKEAIIANMPGTDNDWMRFIGNHEGAHLFTDEKVYSNFQTMAEEIAADRIAMQITKDRGQDDIALAAKDLRSLAAWGDPKHSSAPLSNNNDEITTSHYIVAQDFRGEVDDFVDDNFDWDSYEGDAKNPHQLLKENPDAYFETAEKLTDDLASTAIEDYNKDPSLDNQKAVYDAQIMIWYHKNFEDAYKRRVMGEDIPERAPIQLFSQEQEEAYVENIDLHEKVRLAERNLDTSAYTGEFSENTVLKNFDWDSHPDADDRFDLSYEKQNALHMDFLESQKDQVMQNFANNPNMETLERVLALQNAMNDARYTNEKLEAMNKDLPRPQVSDIEPIVLISESEKEAVIIRDVQEREAAEKRILESHKNVGPQTIPEVKGGPEELELKEEVPDNGYTPGEDGTAYTTNVAIKPGGTPSVDFDNGIQVSGMAVVDFFNKNSNPDPDSITLVNALNPVENDPSTAYQNATPSNLPSITA